VATPAIRWFVLAAQFFPKGISMTEHNRHYGAATCGRDDLHGPHRVNLEASGWHECMGTPRAPHNADRHYGVSDRDQEIADGRAMEARATALHSPGCRGAFGVPCAEWCNAHNADYVACSAESQGYVCDRNGKAIHQLHHDPEDCTWWILIPDYQNPAELNGIERPSCYILVSDPILSERCPRLGHDAT
jgi:hypothetical protein